MAGIPTFVDLVDQTTLYSYIQMHVLSLALRKANSHQLWSKAHQGWLAVLLSTMQMVYADFLMRMLCFYVLSN